ncbi:MAG: ComEC/Rec2 family competence protein [Lachnospiraceae bacterium]|nr:ComEC/Rec2 family competence protein [Lachnospiraceae bacterium]
MIIGESAGRLTEAKMGLIIIIEICIIATGLLVAFVINRISRINRHFLRRKVRLIIVYTGILCLIVNIGFVKYRNYNDKLHSLENGLRAHERVRVCGKITKSEEKSNGIYYYLEDAYVSGKNYQNSNVNIILYVKDEEIEGITGETIDAYAKYDSYKVARNKGGFNERKYYYELGIAGRFIKENDDEAFIISKRDIVSTGLYRLKCHCINILDKITPAKYLGIYKGILLGDKSDIESDTRSLYKMAGISHLLAISGLHISLIGYFVYKTLRKIMGLYPSGILTFTIILCYGNMIGENISAKRAIIMFGVSLLAKLIGRTYDILSALTLAFIIIIYTNPLAIFNSGMLLSFGAILGIILLHTPLMRFLKINNKLISSFMASEMINTVIRPMSAYFYYEISMYSSVINIIIIPFMGIIVVCGILGIILGSISIHLGSAVIWIGCRVLQFYDFVCRLFLKMPYATRIVGIPGNLRLVIYFGLLIIAVILLHIYLIRYDEADKNYKADSCDKTHKFDNGIRNDKTYMNNNDYNTVNYEDIDTFKVRNIKRISVCMVLILLNVILLSNNVKGVRINMLDVGQGDSICINNAGNTLLVDAGSSSEKDITKYTILPFLKASGIECVDYLIMTHSDMDHISGMNDLMEYKYNGRNYVKNIIVPKISEIVIDENYRNIISKAEKEKINVIYLGKGDIIQMKGMQIRCLWPEDNRKLDKNDLSLTFYLSVSESDFRMLFTGDLGVEGEKMLIKSGISDKINVLKTGHHGSNNSSSAEFLKALSPEVSIISCGVNNRYGHPGQDALKRLKDIASDIYVTKDTGEIDIHVNERGFKVETFLH